MIEPIPEAVTTWVLIAALSLIPLGDLAATSFLGRLWWLSKVQPVPGSEYRFVAWRAPWRIFRGRSWLLALLTGVCSTITTVYAYFTFLTARRLLGAPPLDRTQFVSAVALIALGVTPIAIGVAFYASRTRHGRPPPFDRSD
jgi:hypothetical protein